MGPVGPGGPIDQNWRGEHRLPLLRLNRRVIRYDLGELMAWRQKQGRFFDIATLFKLDKRCRFFRNSWNNVHAQEQKIGLIFLGACYQQTDNLEDPR